MKRELCYKAPVFSLAIEVGDRVKVTYRNRKGAIKFQGKGSVEKNNGHQLVVDIDPSGEKEITNNLIFMWARDVYFGKHSVDYLGRERE